MTIRGHIRRRVLLGYALVLFGVVLFIGAEFLLDEGVAYPLGFPLAFIPFIVAVIYLNFGLRCPRCKGNLSMTPAAYPSFSSKHRFNYCPYCGISVDEELGAPKGDA
jgi:hypothetical protein